MRSELLLALALLWASASARIHTLHLKDDTRWIFSIETFGFLSGGTLKLSVSGFKMHGGSGSLVKAGFLLHKTSTESSVVESIEEAKESRVCVLDDHTSSDHVLALDPASPSVEQTIEVAEEGLYDLIFTRCQPEDASVSLTVRAAFMNPGGNYLGAGDAPLPWMYISMALVFAAATAFWIVLLRRRSGRIHTIHHLFTVLVVLKSLSLLFEGVMYHSINATGTSVGYNVVYYILNFCKGLLLFTIIVLVGTGWSLVKPFLNKNEKRVFLVVIPLQVINNIGIIVVDEMAPGSRAYDAWRTVLHMADILCCIVVLLPVVWSIRHLRSAAAADGKARETLNRLTQFRSFYLATVAYIYFTRIIVYIMEATLPFRTVWLAAFFAEVASLLFYAAVGFHFRPGSDNPYIRVHTESDEDDEEFGLEEGDEIDTSAVTNGSAARSERPARVTPAAV